MKCKRVHCVPVASETATETRKTRDMNDTAQIWQIKDGYIVEKHNAWDLMEEIGTACIEEAAKYMHKLSNNLCIAMVLTDRGWKRN